MIVVWAFRIWYLAAVLAGLFFTIRAYFRARWLFRNLMRDRINGVRQLLASHFLREEIIRLTLQLALLLPAIGGLLIQRTPGFVIPPPATPWVVLMQLAYIYVASALAFKAWMNQHDRELIENSLLAEERKR